MSSENEKKTSADNDFELKTSLLRGLPFDVIDQIISDLPFDSVMALLAAKDHYITECVRLSSTYKKAFHDIKTAKDLEGIVDIINFCYEVSAYRHTTSELCWDHGRASRAWDNTPWRSCWIDRDRYEVPDFKPCNQDHQSLYRSGTMRGIRWNRPLLSKHTNLRYLSFQATPTHLSTTIQEQELRFWDRSDILSKYGDDHTVCNARILYQVQSKLKIDPSRDLYFMDSCQPILHAINTASLSIEQSHMLDSEVDISVGVDEFIRSIRVPQLTVVEKALTPVKQILMAQNNLQFFLRKKSMIPTDKNYLYTVPTPHLSHIFWEEAVKHVGEPLVSNFAIMKLEKEIHQKMGKAPVSTYWFFHDYFKHFISPSERLKHILFSKKDQRLFDDGQFWFYTLQAAFHIIRSKQLLELAGLIEKYPFMLMKDADPGSEARNNFEHIRDTFAGRAKKLNRYDPFARRKQPLHLWLMKCPGLPLIPLQKHLAFFLDMLVQHPLDVSCVKDTVLAGEVLRMNSHLGSTYSIPQLVCGELNRNITKKTTEVKRLEISAASNIEQAGTSQKLIDDSVQMLRGHTYPDEMLVDIAIALQGLAFIHRTGSTHKQQARIQGDYHDGSLTFSRWRKGNEKFVLLNREERREPYHSEDMEWLLAFLKCCVYFKENFLTTSAQHKARYPELFDAPTTKST